jgi:hypothetical protein
MGLGDAGVGRPHVWAWRPHIGIGSKESARDPQEEASEFKKTNENLPLRWQQL